MTVAGRRGALIAALIALGADRARPGPRARRLAAMPVQWPASRCIVGKVARLGPVLLHGETVHARRTSRSTSARPTGSPMVLPEAVLREGIARGFGRGFVGPFCAVGGAVIYSAPYYGGGPAYASSPVYYDPPAYVYSAPAATTVAVVPPAPAPPMQNVVEYPHGRYELRGDGVNTAYTWVWVPAPPSAPPPPATAAASPLSAGPREVYRWTDADGVLHMTDRLASVPERYRAAAKQSAQP